MSLPMLLHCGLELRKNDVSAALVNQEGDVVVRKVIPNNLKLITAFLEPYRSQFGNVVLEETKNWCSLAGVLAERGFKTLVI